MKKMYRITIFVVLAVSAAFAQQEAAPAGPPPSGLEETVRARANELFMLFQKQEYRKAENWIAEETKDYYYGGSKPEIHKFEVQYVEFSENFTHAKVLIQCVEPVVVAGFPPGEMTVKIPTLWKIENGNWFYYEDPEKIRNPSGLQNKIKAAVDSANATLQSPEDALKDLPKDSAFVLGKLSLDKSAVTIQPGKTATVIIANGSTGPVSLELGYPLHGIEAKLDRLDVNRGEKATLTLTAGKEPSGGTYYLRVMPTGEPLAVQVDAEITALFLRIQRYFLGSKDGFYLLWALPH